MKPNQKYEPRSTMDLLFLEIARRVEYDKEKAQLESKQLKINVVEEDELLVKSVLLEEPHEVLHET